MPTFRLTIECDNETFRATGFDDDDSNNDAARAEVARILRNLAKYFTPGNSPGGSIYDANGNKAGNWSME